MKKFLLFLFMLLLGVNSAYAFGDGIDINYDNGIYHIVLKGEKIKKRIKAYAVNSLETNKDVHKASGAALTVNAGYFDPKNEKTISYVVINRQTYEDPIMNENGRVM